MSDRWIVVRNWDRFQHYRDRTVPWIKFYTELTHDDNWRDLSAGRRGMLCSIWLEYAQSRCRLRADTRSLSRRTALRIRQDDLKALKKAGFIDICSRPNLEHVKIASRPTRARKEAEEEKEEEPVVQTSTTDVAAPTDFPTLNNGRYIDVDVELRKMLPLVRGADDRTIQTWHRKAEGLPLSEIAELRERSVGQPARWVTQALAGKQRQRGAA